MTRTIDLVDAELLINKEVQRVGYEWVYKEHYSICSYNPLGHDRLKRDTTETTETTDAQPTGDHCIVGGAIEEFLDIRMVHENGKRIEGIWSEDLAREVEAASRAQGKPVRFTKEAIILLRTAQAVQDGGGSHGLARIVTETLGELLWDLKEHQG